MERDCMNFGTQAAESTPQPDRDQRWSGPAVHAGLLDALDRSRICLLHAWPEGHPALRSITNLLERLIAARLQVAVLGQFKRGKSTFINALLGVPVLPSAVIPATAVPTFIAWSATPLIRITYLNGRPAEEVRADTADAIREHMLELVTEEGNPQNRKGITRVDLLIDADVLRDGLLLIDTPGIGSTLQHNTETALQILPECDAALFIFSVDPPITEAEITYLGKVQANVVRIFFVLNKIDYLNPQEQTEALIFARRVLERGWFANRPSPLPLSARMALEAKLRGDKEALAASGIQRIEHEVLCSLEQEKAGALAESVRIKAAAVLGQAISDLQLKIRSLELPVEDLAQRARALNDALRTMETEQIASHDSLKGDRRRTVEELERQADRLRAESSQHLRGVMARVIDNAGGSVDRDAIQRELDGAIPAFFENKLEQVSADFRELVNSRLSRHQQRTEGLIASIRQTVASLFDVPFRPGEAAEPFRLGPEPYWLSQQLPNVLIPPPTALLTALLPARLREKRLREELDTQIDALVLQNVENLRWSTLRGVDETFRRFSAQLEERLAEATLVTQGVVNQALERRRSEAGRSAGELESLSALTEELNGIRSEITGESETCR
jgi:Dynamin family